MGLGKAPGRRNGQRGAGQEGGAAGEGTGVKLLPEMVLEHLVLSVLSPSLLVREGCLVLGWASPSPRVSIFFFFFGAEFERNHAGDEKSLLSAQPQSCMEPHGGKLPLNGFPCWQTTGLSCLRLTKGPNHLDWGVWHWWLSHPDPSESLLKAPQAFLESNSEEPFLLGTHQNQLSPFLPLYELLLTAGCVSSEPSHPRGAGMLDGASSSIGC